MRLDHQRVSDNLEDRRGQGGQSGLGGLGLRGGRLGIGTIVLALAAWYFGLDPSMVLNLAEPPTPRPQENASAPQANDAMSQFVGKVLAETEDIWSASFAAAGKRYQAPRLVLFTGATATACGTGQAAMGPFYCPADQKVYIDLDFFHELRQRFQAPGEFAQAYVIAHEIGHHVQHLLGYSQQVEAIRQRGDEAASNRASVKLELQADCFAGVWAAQADAAHQILEAGEVEQALQAAAAIGDDTLQKQARGHVVPDSFTHGSSAQRVRWFTRGLESGSANACNTFTAGEL